MKSRICRLLLSLLVLVSASVTVMAQSRDEGQDQQATPEKPSWRCLPETTVVAAHVPDPSGFTEALRQRTKLGEKFLSKAYREKVWKAIKEQDADGWEEMTKDLERFGLKPDDAVDLLRMAGARRSWLSHASSAARWW